MTTLHGKCLRIFSILLKTLLLLVIVSVIWQFVSIQLRLSRNGKIAQQLVETLKAQFPGADIRGGASYEREIIYISVLNPLDKTKQQDVERWLREQKLEQRIAPQIWLRFADDLDKEVILK